MWPDAAAQKGQGDRRGGACALRLIRILRLPKAVRYVSAMSLFRRVLTSRREELTIAAGVTLLLLIAASSLILSSGFSEELQKRRRAEGEMEDEAEARCPHCGEPL